MRETLTFLAALVLAALVAAVAVPPFVDWTAYGSALAVRLGAALDADVRLSGPISVRLLPSPRLEVGSLRIARPGAQIETGEASLELALAPLLRGAVSVAAAQIERPQVTIDTRRPAALPMPSGPFGIDRITVRDGAVTLLTPAGPRRLDHIDATGSAEGAAGPFKADGFLRLDRRVLPFRLATGSVQNGQLAIKLEVDPLPGLPRVEAAGALLWDGVGPRFAGTATLSGEIEGIARTGAAALPWHAQFVGQATADEMRADAADLRFGDDAVRLAATGSGRLRADGLHLALVSERPDFDRFAAAYGFSRWADASAVASGIPLAIEWRADAALLGGEVAADLRATLVRDAGSGARVRVRTSLAVARGTASFAGDFGVASDAAGDLAVSTSDAPAFSRWLGRIVPGWPTPPLPFTGADVAGRLTISGGRTEVSALRATLGRSTLTGRVVVVPGSGQTAPRIEADLTADALDLDALPDLSGLPTAVQGFDGRVSLDAQAIRVSRVGGVPVAAGRIGLTFARAGDVTSLDRLTLDNLGGAGLRATGTLSSAGAHLDLTTDASRLGDLAALARRIVPGALTDAFAARANVLSPASLTAAVDADASAGLLSLKRVGVTGKAGDTKVRADFAPTATGTLTGTLTGSLSLDAPDTAPLLRQLGVQVLPIRGQGFGRIEAKLSGRAGAPFAVSTVVTLAGAVAVFQGTATLAHDGPAVAGAVRLETGDLGPLLRILAAPVDTFAAWPASVGAQIDAQDGRVALATIEGKVGGTTVTGTLARDPGGPLAGTLRLDKLDAGSLAAALLGAPQKDASRTFSPLKFSTQPNDPPSIAIDLAANRVALLGKVAATDATAHVALGAGFLDVGNAKLQVAGGTLSGGVTLRRREETASVATSLVFDDVHLASALGSARASGRLDVAGAGTSAADLVGSLAGVGTLRLADVTLLRADPGAPSRVGRLVDAEDIALDPPAIVVALARALDAGGQSWPAVERPVVVEAGQATVAPFDVPLSGATGRVVARFDLANGLLALRETMRSQPPADWTGPLPTVALSFAGPLGAPVRTVDASDLIGTLAAHGLAREQARIAAAEVDRRERAFFNRRLKFDRALDAERRAEQARAEAARREALRLEALRQAEAQRQDRERQDRERQDRERQDRERQDRERQDRERRARPDADPSILLAPDAGTSAGTRPPASREPR